MTSRRLLTLSIAAVLAIVAGLWLAARQGSSGSGEARTLYPQLQAELDSVNAVRIYTAGDKRAVEMVRKDSGWTVSERDAYPADQAKLRKLLIAIADAELYEEKTSNPEQYALLGVEDTSGEDAGSVRIELAGPSAPVDLIVGKQAPGARSHYVRRAGEEQSWLIGASLDTSSSPDAWLDKSIIDVAADRVQSAAVAVKRAKPYTAAKSSRADANFSVEGLPKGKTLSSPSAANGLATALSALTLTDVEAASAFASTPPADRATLKTFDGLVVDLDGWTRDDKHYIAVKTSFDAAQAERFKMATTRAEGNEEPKPAAEDERQKNEAQKRDAKAEQDAPKVATPNVAEEAQRQATKLAGWVYEIPEYKYESIFKPIDELL